MCSFDQHTETFGFQQSESGTLTISNAREDNSGKYTCKGSNNVGEHKDTAELTVGKGNGNFIKKIW